MRQKFEISLNETADRLKIREYAIIDKNLNKVPSSFLREGDYQFLCEEIYDSEAILSSMSKGIDALIAILRTQNIFPIEPHALKIAESVTALYTSPEQATKELFFDDVDLLDVPKE
jgi:hypothetical protein